MDCYTMNEHLPCWIWACLMNTDWRPKAINMFPEREESFNKGQERKSSLAIAKYTDRASSHLRPSTTPRTENSQFTHFRDADRDREKKRMKQREPNASPDGRAYGEMCARQLWQADVTWREMRRQGNFCGGL